MNIKKTEELKKEAISKLGLIPMNHEGGTRYSFCKIGDFMDIPDLLKVQKDSYQWFYEKGLGEVLKDVSPITNHTGTLMLEFFDYHFEDSTKYNIQETKARNATYSKRLIVSVRLIDQETGEIKEQDIFFGDFPVMTENGTFIINGAERVIVSQLVRSPGSYFVQEAAPYRYRGKKIYSSTIMPIRGAWIELETDVFDTVYARVDRTRKIPITTLIRALGVEDDNEILKMFGDHEKIITTLAKDTIKTEPEALIEIYKKLRPGELPTYDAAKNLFTQLLFNDRRYDLSKVGRHKFNQKLALASRISRKVAVDNIVNPETGEVYVKAGDKISYYDAVQIQNSGINSVKVKGLNGNPVTVIGNGTVNIKAYLDEKILANLDINELVNFNVLQDILKNTKKKDLEKTIDERRNELMPFHVLPEDIFASISYIISLDNGVGRIDNIDHLGNRRVRSVGELLQNQFRIGLVRLERVVRERMTIQDLDSVTPQTLINTKPITSAIREFFGSSQLSQFMDQTNPLSELSHKRRISALGPGGLSRERAGFDVRDVHYTHYGRLCPIESPEGPNIGLISALSLFSKINEYGFIETPYRKIDSKTHKISDEVTFMSADIEDEFIIAQATEPTKDGKLTNEMVRVRHLDEVKEVERNEVEYLDVSPKQLVGVGASLIPFLENDDGNRALMGANMQRQAVPLVKTDSPIVGTGMEYKVAKDSGLVVLAKEAGEVTKVTGDVIEIKDSKGNKEVYELLNFKRTNGATCINQKPIVVEGQKVKKGETLTNGPAIQGSELAIGQNILVAFSTWEGYNYEDAILISERLVQDDVYTSVHIDEYECESRETKLGAEEITNEIPNVGAEALKDLDEEGIIRIGAEVRPGDILVGKITPKGETELTAEERLLRAIFGEKSREVRDTSLRVPHGEVGTIVDVKIFDKENSEELKPGVNKVVRIYVAQKRKISIGDKMSGRHGNKGVVSKILPQEDMPYLPDGTPVDIVLTPMGIPSRMNLGQVLEMHLGLAARDLGVKFATPAFSGASDVDIQDLLKLLGRSEDGKTIMYDGRTGEAFDNPITVGVMYMLKLHHLVEDKMHARSTGSYSLVTQQPLGGKAQFGGQRFGEMEVWALEAYGAAHTLQEMLTIKSDDVTQRVKTYEAIVKGEDMPKAGVPESFRVLVKELQGLGLDVELYNDEETVSISEEEEEDTLLTREQMLADREREKQELKELEERKLLDLDEEEEDFEDLDMLDTDFDDEFDLEINEEELEESMSITNLEDIDNIDEDKE